MEGTVSTADFKAKLDRKDPVKMLETLAPERYREAPISRRVEHPPIPRASKGGWKLDFRWRRLPSIVPRFSPLASFSEQRLQAISYMPQSN